MITPVFPSRRAERFAQLLDEAAGARRHHSWSDADSDLTGMVTIGQRVTTLPLVVEVGSRVPNRTAREPDGPHRAGGHRRHRDRARGRRHRSSAGSATCCPAAAPAARSSRPIAAGSLGAFGVSAASGDAMPGDTLYGVKRSAEQAQLALAGSDVSRGQLNLEFARKRLAEAGALGSDLDGSTRCSTTWTATCARASGCSPSPRSTEARRPVCTRSSSSPATSSRSWPTWPTGSTARRKARATESLDLLDRDQRACRRAAAHASSVPAPQVPTDELGALPVVCGNAAPPAHAQRSGAPEATPKPTGPATPTTGAPDRGGRSAAAGPSQSAEASPRRDGRRRPRASRTTTACSTASSGPSRACSAELTRATTAPGDISPGAVHLVRLGTRWSLGLGSRAEGRPRTHD